MLFLILILNYLGYFTFASFLQLTQKVVAL